jgi:catechol 2,3-dioxygenase-like lactoylglutathione lyase family enzyme
VAATIAVTDIERAKEFYEDKLGLSDGSPQPDGGVMYPCADGSIHVFPSPLHAGKSGATLAAFRTEDVEALVDQLS